MFLNIDGQISEIWLAGWIYIINNECVSDDIYELTKLLKNSKASIIFCHKNYFCSAGEECVKTPQIEYLRGIESIAYQMLVTYVIGNE